MTIGTTGINIPWPFVVLAIVLFIAAAVIRLKAEVKRRRNSVSRIMESLGMNPIEDSDPELQQHWNRLRIETSRKPTIALAWKRDESFGQLYLLDLWMDDEKQRRRIVSGYALVVVNHLNMPRFSLFPKVQSTGIMGRVTKHLQSYVFNRLGQISFVDAPEFDQYYAVTGNDETAIRQFLNTACLWELTRLKGRCLEADGNMYIYSRSTPNTDSSSQEEAAIYNLIEEVKTIYRVFAQSAERCTTV